VVGEASDDVWVADGDGNIYIWDAENEKQTESIKAHGGKITSLLHAGEHVWSSGSDKLLRVWSMKPLKQRKEIKTSSLLACITRVESKVWTASVDMEIVAYSMAKMKAGAKLNLQGAHPGTIGSMLWPGNTGPLVWVGTDRDIIRVTAKKLKPVDHLEGHTGVITAMMFVEATGNVWSASNDKTIRVWSRETGECLKVLEGHTAKVFNLVHEAPHWVWSCSWDGGVLVWDAASYRFVGECEAQHKDAVSSFVLVGRRLWTGSWDHSVCVWPAMAAQAARPSLHASCSPLMSPTSPTSPTSPSPRAVSPGRSVGGWRPAGSLPAAVPPRAKSPRVAGQPLAQSVGTSAPPMPATTLPPKTYTLPLAGLRSPGLQAKQRVFPNVPPPRPPRSERQTPR